MITADTLTMLYGTPIDVLRDRAGRLVVVGQPDAPAAHPRPGPVGGAGALMQPHLSWNLVDDVRQMLAYPFMVNALRAGALVAVVAGAIGWVMVLRRQSFAGHTLAVVGFPGAAAAIWLGVATGWGYFGACIAAALVIAALPPSARRGGLGGFGEESAADRHRAGLRAGAAGSCSSASITGSCPG